MHHHNIPLRSLVGVLLVSLGLSLGCEAAERPTDFRGLRWGTPIRAVPDLQAEAVRQETAPGVTYYTRAAEDRAILGVEPEVIRYMAAHDRLIGVVIHFRHDREGLAHCEQAMTRLRELYGAPNQHRAISHLPHKPGRNTAAVAEPTPRFAEISPWFARHDTEAQVTITCPAHAESFPGLIDVRWRADPSPRPGATSPLGSPADPYEVSAARPR